MFQTIHLKKLLSSLAITLGIGFLVGLLLNNQTMMYRELVKPPLSPPGSVFPIVWGILYFLMGISLYLVKTTEGDHSFAMKVFYLQLFLNFCWSFLFFGFQLYCFSAAWLILLVVAIISTMILFYAIKPAAFWLLVPYLLWCIFATYLNIGVCILN